MAIESYGHFIDGAWTSGTGDRTLMVVNPATEEAFAQVPDGSERDAIAAIEAAERAFDDGRGPWPSMNPSERSLHLHRFCDALERNIPEFQRLMRCEVGSVQALDHPQLFMPIELTRYWADQAASFPFVEPLAPVKGIGGNVGQGVVLKEPIGVVAAITPFNFPVTINLWKIGPALAMGNTLVLKPSPYTPVCALLIARLAAEAGLPDGVLNVVSGDRAVGEVFTNHPAVALVSFTGSDVVGRKVMAQAATSLKKVVLELGGKSANVIFADADLDHPGFMASALMFTAHCGQGCSLTTRILVEDAIHDELVSRIQTALGQMQVGDPADSKSMIGPLIREAQRARVERYLELGRQEGAVTAFGGGRPVHLPRGFFVEPTLLVDVRNEMQVAQEEIFGPVASVIRFSGTEQAIQIANASRYGLSGAVWSRNRKRAYEVAGAMRTGGVAVNGGDATPRGLLGPAPYGGYKHSGIGREHGRAGAEEFLEFKTVNYPIG